MTVLEWDQVGDRVYQTGVDRGVLYLKDSLGTAIAWNGLTSVEDTSNSDLKSFFIDGIKFLDIMVPGDYLGKLKAITYPEEFDRVVGTVKDAPGMLYTNQPFQSFNLSYRTKVGNDVDGIDHGYKIHLLYNLVANPDPSVFETLNNNSAPFEFGWTLSGTPPTIDGHRPTAHLILDSNESAPEALQELENILYGTAETDPYFPSITEVAAIYGTFGALIIVDNGDGTWTAYDVSDDYITMVDDTTFRIDDADATYLDTYTYQISSTNV